MLLHTFKVVVLAMTQSETIIYDLEKKMEVASRCKPYKECTVTQLLMI
jgi:hypothetical protein